MLTGDKIETAKCIAIATGLKTKKEQIFEMRNKDGDLTDAKQISESIEEFNKRHETCMLMITGTTLSVIIANA